MLKEPLFKISSLTHANGSVTAVLKIDEHSEIFEGHFPGQPVVPGACMLQIIKEVLMEGLDTSVRLVKADNIKFLSLVEPHAKTLQLNLTYQLIDNDIKVTANLTAGEVVCMKLQAIFRSIK